METPSSNSLLRSNIRPHRHTPIPRAQESSDMDFTPVAGPSTRLQFNVVDEEDDNQPTPRMQHTAIPSPSSSYGPIFEFGASTSSAIPSDTPAARLRALLARSSDSPSGKYPPARPFVPPSEAGSGTAPSATPSIIRDSLKDLFSHARREPGDTPQKSRPRRSSFDSSEMDITPVIGREREQHKGKRKSLSDDEVDKPKSSKGSESSFRSSHAATLDTLRARLMSSRSQLLDEWLPTAVYDVTSQHSETGSLHSGMDGHANAGSTAALLHPLDSYLSLPPIRTGSPSGTFQLPSQLVSRSNLLDRDSEMQHAMSGLESTSEDVPVPSTKGLSTTPLRPRSSASFRRSLRLHDQSRRASLELPGSRATSALSNADFERQEHSRVEERKHQREREWNRPKVLSRPATPELQHRHSLEFNRRHSQEMPWTSPSHVKSLSHEAVISRNGSPLSGRNLQRRGSAASLRSFDDDQSSRPSSMSSQADSRDRMAELHRDHYIEREREWNKRHPPPRPSSSLSSSSNHSHTHPVRPPSATAYSSPTHASLQRQASSSSLNLNRPSGASSPASSRGSLRDPEDEEEREVSHERERNWNSPHPKWATARHHSHVSGTDVTSAGAKLSRSKTESPRPSILASGAMKLSSIPAGAASKKNGIFSNGNFAYSTPARDNDEEQFMRGHRRRSTEFTESVGTIPPQSSMSGAFGHEDMVLASDEESISGFIFQSTTPDTPLERSKEDALSEAETEVLISPPRSPRQRSSPVQSHPGLSSNDEARLRRVLASTSSTSFRPRAPDSPLKTSPAQEQTTPPSFTPPGTPPPASTAPQDGSSPEPIPTFALTTPPRRLSSSTSILDFRTPSPPHDLSNLSILPSEDEVETREADVTPVRVDDLANPNYTAMKTPRPPGGWAFTPVPSKHTPREASPPPAPSSELTRANSEPEQHSKPEAPAGNGLLTPIPSLSRANSLPLRTPAPPGAWMSTPNQPSTQNGSIDQSQFGSVGRRKSILKVRFDVTESEASTAEVEYRELPSSAVRISATDPLPNGHVPQAESVLAKKTNGSAQGDATYDPVQVRPVTPERSTTPVSRANAPSPRSLRKSPSLKVVDAFGREKIDEIPRRNATQDIAHNHVDAKEAIHLSSSADTPRKSNIRIVDAMGKEIEEEAAPVTELKFDESSSVLHEDPPVGRTETLSQMRQTLREWADELSDGDRSVDDLALNTSHLEELEEVSRAARHARNQLAQTLHVESVKSHDLMDKYAEDTASQSGRILTTIGNNSSFHRVLVWFGVVVQIIFVLAMWRFAHVQARRLFYTVYYDPLYPELTSLPGQSHQFLPPYLSFPWSLSSAYEIVRHNGWTALKAELQGTLRRIGEHAWERWGERPYAGTWPPT